MSGKLVISNFENILWVVMCGFSSVENISLERQVIESLSNRRVVFLSVTDPDTEVEFQCKDAEDVDEW